MDIKQYFNQKKELNKILLSFLESDDETEEEKELKKINDFIQDEKIGEDREEFQLFIRQILKIADNHHRSPNFMNNVKQILYSLKDNIKKMYTNLELFNQFNNNKEILLFFLEKSMITLEDDLFKIFRYKIDEYDTKFCHYFYPELKDRLDETSREQIEEELKKENSINLDDFEKVRQTGLNSFYICQLIREDSIDEFIKYINERNISENSTINQSLFETNRFLLERKPTLIEYSAFYGSIRILKYLKLKGVELTQSLINYAIHSRNAEMIQFLEEEIKFDYNELLKEAIKCHHTEIAEYALINNTIDDTTLIPYCLNYDNFAFLPIDSLSIDVDYIYESLCQNDYLKLVEPKLNDERNLYYIFQSVQKNNSSIVFEFLMKIIKSSYIKNKKVTKIEFSPKFRCIAHNFLNYKSLTSVTLPPSANVIRLGAFMGCVSLLEVKMSSSVYYIERSAFEDCFSLSRVIFYEPTELFYEKNYDVKCINNFAFKNCYSLKEIEIPTSISIIKEYSFLNCKSLTKVNFHPFVTFIGHGAFLGCPNVNIDQLITSLSLKNIGSDVFCNDSIAEKICCLFVENIPLSYDAKDLADYSGIDINIIDETDSRQSVEKYYEHIGIGYIFIKLPAKEVIDHITIDEKNSMFKMYPSISNKYEHRYHDEY